MIVKIILCIIIPLMLLSIILDRRSRKIILSLCTGSIACFLAYLLNTTIFENFRMSNFYLSTTIAPIVEESMKFIPILLFSIIFSFKKEDIFPMAFAVGIGFGIIENFYLFANNIDSSTISWVVLKGLGSGLMHALSASIIALGINKAKEYPKISVVGILSSLFLAMIFHGVYNCLVFNNNALTIVGFALPIITYVIMFIIYKKDMFKHLLLNNHSK